MGRNREHDYFVDAFSRVSIGDAKDLESEEEEVKRKTKAMVL